MGFGANSRPSPSCKIANDHLYLGLFIQAVQYESVVCVSIDLIHSFITQLIPSFTS